MEHEMMSDRNVLLPKAQPCGVPSTLSSLLTSAVRCLLAALVLFHAAPARAQSAEEVIRPWNCLTYSAGDGSPFGRQVPPAGCVLPAVPVPSGIARAIERPEAPTGLTATVNGRTVFLNWTPARSGGTPMSYVVQAGSASGLADMVRSDTESDAPTVTATRVPDGKYFFRVLAQNESGTSVASNEVFVQVGMASRFTKLCLVPTPPASTQLTATQFVGSDGGPQVRFDWRAGEEGDCQAFSPVTVGYWIEYGTRSGGTDGRLELPIGSLGGTTTYSVPLGGITGTFYIRVRGVNGFGPGAASNEIVLNVGGVCNGAPTSPANLKATSAGSTIALVWDEVSPLRNRSISYAGTVSPSMNGVTSVGIGGPLITVNGATVFGLYRTSGVPAGSYVWQIVAINACGRSAPSTVAVVVTGPNVPVRVSGVYSWRGAPSDGGNWSTLILARSNDAGYGTTTSGAVTNPRCVANRDGCGIFYKISGTGARTILHQFGTQPVSASTGNPAIYPFGAPLEAADGTFWGTTTGQEPGRFGAGAAVLYRLARDGSSMTFISELGGPSYSAPMQASDGTIYGTTVDNGPGTCSWLQSVCTPTTGSGTIFKVNSNGTGFTYIHTFTGANGSKPYGGLMQATDGTLWGTTSAGGTSNLGTIYKIVNGTFSTVYSFRGGSDGANPAQSAMIQASDGNLFGTTQFGGSSINQGTVFRLSPTTGTVTILHAFTGKQQFTGDDEPTTAQDGLQPVGTPIEGPDGRMYGVAGGGGALGGGIAYSLKKDGSDYQQLYAFSGGPESGGLTTTLIMTPDGNFYGTGQYGGGFNWGAIFQMTRPQ